MWSFPSETASWLTRGRLVVIALLTLVSWVILSAPTIPLGVPGEWTWARRAFAEIDPLAVIRTLSLCGGYWTAVVWREKTHKSPAIICVIAFLWLSGLLYLQPDVQGLSRAPTVLYYKRTEGYFWQASYEVEKAKEFLAGYWIVDVETPERAFAIAAEASAAPGPGGAPLNMAIEVRQVMSGPPKDLI